MATATYHTFLADHGLLLCAEDGGAPEGTIIDGRPGGLLTATRTTAGAWETIGVEPQEPGVVALRSSGGFCACAENEGRDGIIVFRSTSVGAWERWLVRGDGTRVSFEAECRPGYFVKAWPDGRVTLDQPMFNDEPTATPGPYETFTVDPPLVAAGPGNPNVPPAGMSRIAGRGFADDAGPRLPVVATHMDAIYLVEADPGRFADNLDYLASLGFHQRVLGILGWEGQEVDPRDPAYWDRARTVVAEAFARGIRTHFTVFADLYLVPELHTQSARIAHAHAFVERFSDLRHCFLSIEGCNEPGNGQLWSNWGTPADLVEVSRIIGEGLGVPWAPGALYGGIDSTTSWWTGREPPDDIAPEARYLIDHSPAVSMHFDRGQMAEGLWRPVRQPWEGANTADNKMFWDNEPVGYDSSVTWYNMGSPTLMNPSTETLHRIACLASFMSSAALYCFHTEGGTGYSSNRPIRGERGGPEVAAARNILPLDLANWDKHNWHWSSNPVETVDGCIYDHGMQGRGTLRTISATAGESVIVHPFCIPEGATLRARAAMHLTKYEFYDGAYRQTGELSLSAGATWEQDAAYDVLYKGRFV